MQLIPADNTPPINVLNYGKTTKQQKKQITAQLLPQRLFEKTLKYQSI
jgi:hypothetical protein